MKCWANGILHIFTKAYRRNTLATGLDAKQLQMKRKYKLLLFKSTDSINQRKVFWSRNEIAESMKSMLFPINSNVYTWTLFTTQHQYATFLGTTIFNLEVFTTHRHLSTLSTISLANRDIQQRCSNYKMCKYYNAGNFLFHTNMQLKKTNTDTYHEKPVHR